MRFGPYGECMTEIEGVLIGQTTGVTVTERAREWVEEVRKNLPERMRYGEETHPRYPRRGAES